MTRELFLYQGYVEPINLSFIIPDDVASWAAQDVMVTMKVPGISLDNQPFIVDPSILVVVPDLDSWFVQNAIPVQPGKINLGPQEFAPIDGVPVVSSWMPEWILPHPKPVLVNTGRYVSYYDPNWYPVPEVTSWYRDLSTPVLQPQALQEQEFISEILISLAPVPDMDGWYKEFSSPVREVPYVVREFYVQPLEPIVPAVTINSWYNDLSQPVVVQSGVDQLPGTVLPPLFIPRMESWYYDFSIPVVISKWREGLYTSTLDPITFEPDFDSWFRQLSQPVRRPLTLHLGYSVSSLEPIAPPAIPDTAWFRQLSEPVLPRVQLSQYPSFTQPLVSITSTGVDTASVYYTPRKNIPHFKPKKV